PAVFAATVAPQFPPETAKEYLASTLAADPAGTGVSYLRGQYRQPLWILLGVAGLVLLIACANLANLMLARASAREREIAVRIATCLLFGLTPAVRATRQSAASAMKAGARGSSDTRERFGLRRVLVSAQVALSFVLIVGALLFVRTVRNLATLDPGFRQDDVLIADFDTRAARVPPRRQADFERELRNRLAAIPGVEAVSDAAIEPASGSVWNDRVIVGGGVQQTVTNENHVSPGFFKMLGTSLLAGRDFDERDTPGAPLVAIVNEAFAEKFLKTKQPIGRTFKLQVSPSDPDPA